MGNAQGQGNPQKIALPGFSLNAAAATKKRGGPQNANRPP
jgi:hypothetical protein